MKILVAEFHHLGDALLSLPFVRGALANGHQVQVWCRPAALPIFQLLAQPDPTASGSLAICTWEPPWHEETPTHSLRQSLHSCRTLARLWRNQGFAAAVSVWADARLHGLFAAARIPRRIGFPMTSLNYYGSTVPWRQQRLRQGRLLAAILPVLLWRPLLTQPLHRLTPRQHHLVTWGQIAHGLGFPLLDEPPWFQPPDFPLPELDQILRQTANQKILFIHPGGRLACKTWAAANYAQVLIALPRLAPDWAVILCQAPGENCPHPVHPNQFLFRPDSLDALVKGVSVSHAFLGNDSLAAHLASACGKPTLAIFGSSDPEIYAPGNNASSVIRVDACPLHPCLDLCRQPSVLCLEAVKAERVFERLAKMLL